MNNEAEKRVIKRGDIFYVELKQGVGSEQNGCRPMLILQNDVGNRYSNTVIASVISSQRSNKPRLPTHCPVKAQQRLNRDSVALLEQISTIDKLRLREYVGTLSDDEMKKIDNALAISVGLSKFIKNEPNTKAAFIR